MAARSRIAGTTIWAIGTARSVNAILRFFTSAAMPLSTVAARATAPDATAASPNPACPTSLVARLIDFAMS